MGAKMVAAWCHVSGASFLSKSVYFHSSVVIFFEM